MKTQQQGFTLVELIVVIVILGILAATALPRFVGLQGDARVAVIKGIAASMESAKQLVQARWLVAGSTGLATVSVTGATVTVVTGTGATAGFPIADANGMVNAIIVPSTVTCTPSATTTVCEVTGLTGCAATYTVASGAVTVGATSTNCGG